MTSSEYDERLAAQTEALATLGFDPAFNTNAFFGREMATCSTCGAAVVIEHSDRRQPVQIHHEWHQVNGETSAHDNR